MDLVAIRNHSELELRKKLATRCEANIVDQAIDWAKGQNWLPSQEVLKDQLAEQMGRKGKGIQKINQKLNELGLDSVKSNAEDELEKAKRLALAKWSCEDFQGLSFEEAQKLKAQIIRFLFARGYESSVVSKILKNEFKAGALSHDEEY